MNKITRIFLVTMCAGVLLTGIGAGIAFGEYSSLEYRKLEAPEGNGPVQAEAEFTVPAEGPINIHAPIPSACSLVTDEGVPQGTIIINASCDAPADSITINEPYVATIETGQYGGTTSAVQSATETITDIGMYPTCSGGMELFMMYKDQVLDGLKQGFICIPPDYYESFTAEIRVNPADAERIYIG